MEKKKEQAKVLSQEMLADGIYSLWIETEAARTARPGQFVSVYTADASKLLPRPISICEIDKEGKKLRLVYRVTGEKTGTKQFSELKAGDTVPVIGPLGNGFPYEKAEGKKVFLMGGGIGVPPILELAKQIQCEEKQIVVGYRDAHTFLKDEFEQNGTLYISTEDGSLGEKGFVTQHSLLNSKLDKLYVCGPKPMMVAVARFAHERNISCEVSLENMMACGVGACLCCVEDTIEGNTCVCKEGPIFNIEKLKWQI